ncbi:MAG: hypothetical protein GY777_16765 [Candidatus Brocadiaceae bacterium]|nr:hypothetical protein [Candidatus Brocadiaceae bacterium]
MKKKNVLGTDPLSWLKEKDNKENLKNTESDIDGQEKQVDKPSEPNDVDEISANIKMQEVKAAGVSNIEKALRKPDSDPVSVSETHKQEEEETCEPSDDEKAVHRRKVLGEDAYSYHSRNREVIQKESPATMFVIVYTVLLLILGFIVYRDLTKQIDTLNTKLTNLEKQVDAGIINYEDTKVNDVW